MRVLRKLQAYLTTRLISGLNLLTRLPHRNNSEHSARAAYSRCLAVRAAAFLTFFIALVLVDDLQGQRFTLPILPDTQVEVCCKVPMFQRQLDWIVSNRDRLHIPLVLHVGDVVNFDNVDQWETASSGFERFDNVRLPYAIAVGNHDTSAVGEWTGSAAPGNVNENLRKTDKFNAYFPVSRFINQRGRFEPGKSDNAYYTFQVEGSNWLVISLEFCPRQGAINWAAHVLEQHARFHAILLTHYFLDPDGTVPATNAGYGDLQNTDVLDRLVKTHPNLLLVLSGHKNGSSYRVDKGEKGNLIYEILQDYQSTDFGGGYLRLLEIDMAARTIKASMFSPFYDKETGGASTFSFSDIDFSVPKF